MNCYSRLLVLLFGAAATANLCSQTQNIDWGSNFFPGGNLIDSDGNALVLGDGSYTDGGYTFEIGVFDGAFVPDATNTDDWVANWKVFDAIIPSDSDPSDSVSSTFFAGRDVITFERHSESADPIVDNNYEFLEGEQAYVFVRNSNDTDSDSEWLLYTNSTWTFPFVAPESHDPSGNELWVVEDADEAVWGGINAGATTGDGEHAHKGTDYLIQTFTFVPEPSTFGLLLVGSLGLLRRGRRS